MNPALPNLSFQKWMKNLNLATIFLSSILVLLGGIVHNTGSSLACPDWPLCFGQVLPKMEGSVAIEHSHRLLGALVGFFTLLVFIFSISERKSSPLVFRISLAALLIVIFQGVLGGITVLLKLSPLVSTTHLVTSQIFLASLVIQFFALRKSQSQNRSLLNCETFLKPMPYLIALVLIQMALGAFIRHGGASVACGLGRESIFLCLSIDDHSYIFWPETWPARFNMIHRWMGYLTVLCLVFGLKPLLRRAKQKIESGGAQIKKLIICVHGIVTLQVIFGILTLWTGISPAIVTLHLAGALFLWLLLWFLWGSASEKVL